MKTKCVSMPVCVWGKLKNKSPCKQLLKDFRRSSTLPITISVTIFRFVRTATHSGWQCARRKSKDPCPFIEHFCCHEQCSRLGCVNGTSWRSFRHVIIPIKKTIYYAIECKCWSAVCIVTTNEHNFAKPFRTKLSAGKIAKRCRPSFICKSVISRANSTDSKRF